MAHHLVLLVTAAIAPSGSALAETIPVDVGGETNVSRSTVRQPNSVDQDLLVARVAVSRTGDVTGDIHAIGFDIEKDGAVGGDVAAGITLVALLNFIPVFGWIANYAPVFLGIGAITTAIFDSFATGLEVDRGQSLEQMNSPKS